jgi:hypothetical protein
MNCIPAETNIEVDQEYFVKFPQIIFNKNSFISRNVTSGQTDRNSQANMLII